MALRATPFQRAEERFDDSKRRKSERNMEMRNSRFVNDKFGQHIPRSQSDSYGQRKESSPANLEGLPLVPRLVGKHEGCSIDRPADTTMKIPLTTIEDHDCTSGLRSDPVRLSRRAAVKRNSMKERETRTERHDSTMQSTHAPVTNSFDNSVMQPTTEVLPPLRRFSFDQSPHKLSFDLAG